MFPNRPVTGPEHQVEGVAEDDLRPDIGELFRRHRLDRTVGTDGHECGRINIAAPERQSSAPRFAIAIMDIELHAASARVRNIESP